MSKKNEYNDIEKLAIIDELAAGRGTREEVAHKYNISVNTLVKWRHRYELYGMDGLEIRIRNRSYSVELKLQTVQDYLSGQYSQYEVIDTYKIASRTQLKSWINKYNGHTSFKSDNEGAKAMTKVGLQRGKNESISCTIAIALHMSATTERQQRSLMYPTTKHTSG